MRKISKGFIALEGGYNFNQYFGLGIEWSRRSIVVSYKGNITGYNLQNTVIGTRIDNNSNIGNLNVDTGLIKAIGYFPINSTFSLYGDLGLGISSISGKSDNGESYKIDSLKNNVPTESFGIGLKIMPVSYMYLKIGVNMVIINDILNMHNLDDSMADELKDKVRDQFQYLKDLQYNVKVNSSNPKNIYAKELKATIGFQF